MTRMAGSEREREREEGFAGSDGWSVVGHATCLWTHRGLGDKISR